MGWNVCRVPTAGIQQSLGALPATRALGLALRLSTPSFSPMGELVLSNAPRRWGPSGSRPVPPFGSNAACLQGRRGFLRFSVLLRVPLGMALGGIPATLPVNDLTHGPKPLGKGSFPVGGAGGSHKEELWVTEEDKTLTGAGDGRIDQFSRHDGMVF